MNGDWQARVLEALAAAGVDAGAGMSTGISAGAGASPPPTLTCRQVQDLSAAAGVSLGQVEVFALERGIVPDRYSRNIGTLGTDGQAKLLSRAAAVVGLGGLGGHVVECLARLGVGRIVGVDGDVFADSNLNRQLLADMENLGLPKTQAAARRVAQVNPAVEFVPLTCRLEQVGPEALAGVQVVFDCLDSVESRKDLQARCAAAGVFLVHGAISGWCGQVALCPPGSGMLDTIYSGPKETAEKRQGNLPFTAAFAAYLMVSRGLGVLLDRPPGHQGQVVFFDLLGGDWETIQL